MQCGRGTIVTKFERRVYVRETRFYPETRISADGFDWHDIIVLDFSAGGVKFIANDKTEYKIGDILLFRVETHEFPMEFMDVQMEIRRAEHASDGQIIYGTVFIGLTSEQHINIDETILYRKRHLI